MAMNYTISQTRNDTAKEPNVSFSIPSERGTYQLTLNLSDGTKVPCDGNIVVDGGENTYNLKLKSSDGATIDCGNFKTEAVIIDMPYAPQFTTRRWTETDDEGEDSNYVEITIHNKNNFAVSCVVWYGIYNNDPIYRFTVNIAANGTYKYVSGSPITFMAIFKANGYNDSETTEKFNNR